MSVDYHEKDIDNHRLANLILTYFEKGYDPQQTFHYFLSNGYDSQILRIAFKEAYAKHFPHKQIPQSIINYPETSTLQYMKLFIPVLLIVGISIYVLLSIFTPSGQNDSFETPESTNMNISCDDTSCLYLLSLEQQNPFFCQEIDDPEIHDSCIFSSSEEDVVCDTLKTIPSRDLCRT